MNRLPFRAGHLGVVAIVAALLGGCAQTATYNAAYHGRPNTAATDKLPGQAAVLTDKAADDTPFVGPPTSFTGGGTKLTIPLGVIAREIAATVFGDLFRDGAAKTNALAATPGVRVAITPRVSRFSYEYNQLKNLGFAITPTVVLTLDVASFDSAGRPLRTRSYESGTVEMPAYLVSGAPGEEIGKAAHKAIYDLMLKAAADLREDLQAAGGPALAL